MTNRKTTRRALVLSLLSMLLCCSMLVGTTFAWFTDSVTSGNNRIIAGNLDIELYNDVKIDETKRVSNGTPLFEEVALWEPGAVAYENLTVANVGTLALKYDLNVLFSGENTVDGYSLSQILKVGVVENGIPENTSREDAVKLVDTWNSMESFAWNGELQANTTATPVALVIYWEPSATDNDWNVNNGKTVSDFAETQKNELHIDLGIELFATQLTYEKDSFDEKYDESAEVPGMNAKVYTGAELEAAAASTMKIDTIEVMDDIVLDNAVTLPAGVTLKGNGKQIDGTIYAGGDLTIEGYVKVASFSASYYDRTITIGEGACLEITGTGRMTLGYGNVFNITGSLTDAKNTDKTTVQPSLVIPGGISITGANDAAMNVTNAYVKIGNTSSKNSAANGTFTLNITNSIAEFTNQLTLSEPTNGNAPTFKMTVKDSVLTTSTKLCIAATDSDVVIDNSMVTLGSYLRNSGTLTLKNGSVLTGSTIQFGENGGNNGTINVDASELTITATSTGHAFDGKGIGSINLTNGAVATVTYYKAMTVTADATSTFTGTEVQ